jgi:hypothetical protein
LDGVNACPDADCKKSLKVCHHAPCWSSPSWQTLIARAHCLTLPPDACRACVESLEMARQGDHS